MHELVGKQVLYGVAQLHRRLLAWSDNDGIVDWAYVLICLLLTLMAGLMSGLTLGLLSLDTVELEVLLRSGTLKEQKYARKIMPIVAHTHWLLVTLLMCNAVSMEALPLFLDQLADPITAVIVSVTAVLFFGEIIPQSVCSRYGLAIGASLAPFVRLLMWLCSPVAWPMAKLLDLLLGPDHHTLFRRRQLKELVSIHAEDAGMGGALTADEIKVIIGALDLTSKVAYRAMTPLRKVFMLSSSDRLDESTLRSVLRSGHSRIPVHRQGDRGDVVGLVLVKELLQYQYRLGTSDVVPVDMLRMRSIPRLPATTPMYDMLRLFQTGRSHIAVLTQPAPGELRRLMALDPSLGARRGEHSRSRSGKGHGKGAGATGTVGADGEGGGGRGGIPESSAAAASGGTQCATDDARSVAAETEGGDVDADGYPPYGWYYKTSAGTDPGYPPSVLDPQDSSGTGTGEVPPSSRQPSTPEPGRREEDHTGVNGGGLPPAPPSRLLSVFAAAAGTAAASTTDVSTAAPPPRAAAAAAAPVLPPGVHQPHGGRRRTRIGLEAAAAAASSGADPGAGEGGTGSGAGSAAGGSATVTPGGSMHGASAVADAMAAEAGGARISLASGDNGGGGANISTGCQAAGVDMDAGPFTPRGASMDHADVADEDEPEEGRPIGIITIEDVIEELIRSEIVDETDRYVDNNRLIRVNPALLAQSLPEHLTKVLAMAGASKKAAALHRVISYGGGMLGGPAGAASGRRSLAAAGLGLGLGPASGTASPRDLSSHRVPLLQAEQP